MHRSVLFCAALAFAIGCGDNATEPVPDRTATPPVSFETSSTPALSNSTAGATIMTNKDDYIPGEMVVMVGSGWGLGETITLTLAENPKVHEDRVYTVTADTLGDFWFDEFRPELHHVGVGFILTAEGQSTGFQSETTFTDAIVLGQNTTNHNGDPGASELTLQAPNPIAAGHLLVAQVTVEGFGTTDVICTPAGWTSVLRTNNSSSVAQHIFSRVADGTEIATTTWTWRLRANAASCTGTSNQVTGKGVVGGIIAYSGVDVTPASDAIISSGGAPANPTSSTTINAPSLVGPFPAGSRVLRFFGNDKEFVINATGKIYDTRRIKPGGGFQKPTGAAADASLAVAGPTGTVEGSNSGNGGNWVAQTVVLREAAVVTHLLTVTVVGSGTVTSNPTGINCGADCTENFTQGTSVTLTGAPASGSGDAVWSGGGGTTNANGTYTVSMSEARNVTATFTLNKYTLTVTRDGSGSGTVTSSPTGIDCGSTCSASFDHGTAVTLTGTADLGSGAVAWSGGNGTANPDGTYTVSLTETRNVTATFTLANVATSTTVTADKTSPQSFGTSIVFTAEVNVTATSADVTVGSIAFYEGGTCAAPGTQLQASSAVDGTGKVTLTTSTLSVVAHTILACYGGATGFQASSGSLAFTIQDAGTTTIVTADKTSPQPFGTSLVFTAEVNVTATSADVTTGKITFYEGGTCGTPGAQLQAEATVDGNGKVTFTTSTLSVANHTILACYAGATGFAPSSGSLAFTISQIGTTTTLTITPSTQQYSDKVNLSVAISPTSAPGTVQFSKSVNGGAFSNIGSGAVAVASGVAALNGQQITEAAATPVQFKAVFTSTDANVAGSNDTKSLTVTKENATIDYAAGNPGAIPVSQTSFQLTVNVKETNPEPSPNPDPNSLAAFGSIINANLTARLSGISSAQNYNGNCVAGTVSGTGYSAYRPFICTFTGAFTVDAYVIELSVTGDYYTGSYSDALTVYDPNAGFVTGGGKFMLGGDRVSFGLSFTYGKGKTAPRGGLVVIRHHADGGTCRVKSNTMNAPAVSGRTASFTGKGSYSCVNALGVTTASAGNLSVLGYVEDNATPGAGMDKFWTRVYGELLMNTTAASNAQLLTGGNIQVPQPSGMSNK